MDKANEARLPDPVELAIRQLLGDAVYQLAEGSPDGFWASNRLADCRAAIAAYADAERQAGWFAGLHAGQEQGRANALLAVDGAMTRAAERAVGGRGITIFEDYNGWCVSGLPHGYATPTDAIFEGAAFLADEVTS